MIVDDLNYIVKMKFGSHLYGTAGPESDLDFKGIFLPTKEEILLGKIPKCISNNTKTNTTAKNSKDDIDIDMYSLHYFINLACQGETIALDMLHAPDSMILKTSEIWQNIVADRKKFYTKNLKAFAGYARAQAAKYGIKGNRLMTCKKVLDYLEAHKSDKDVCKMKDIWSDLPEGEHISKEVDPKCANVRLYVVCGRKVQDSVSLDYAINILNKYYKNYGARSESAALNEGVDWKAISHALRVIFEVKEILTTNNLIFPLRDAEYLIKVKKGILSFKDEVGPRLEKELEDLEMIVIKSNFPEKVNGKFWDNFIIDTLEKNVR